MRQMDAVACWPDAMTDPRLKWLPENGYRGAVIGVFTGFICRVEAQKGFLMDKALTIPLVLYGESLSYPDLLYATGFAAPDPILYLQGGRRKVLIVSSLEWGRASLDVTGRGITVLTPQHLGLEGARRRDPVFWIHAALEPFGVRRITVPAEFPYGLACRLKKSRIGVALLEGEPFAQRRVKTEDEMACIRQSQRAAVIAMRAACAMIAETTVDRAGRLRTGSVVLTSESVHRRIAEVLLRQDCHSGETIVAGGVQGADPHERGHGPLKAGEPIVIDIFPRHQRHGYWGDITRTVLKGEASAELRRQYGAVKAAQTAALRKIRAGVSGRRVHQEAVAVFDRAGFRTERRGEGFTGFIHSTGHGVGLAIHESPSLGGSDCRLRAGDVITVEPGLYYPESGGIRIEDTVEVTRCGWRYLAPCEKRFVLP